MEVGTVVRGIACDTDQVKIAIIGVPDRPGVAARIFSAIAGAGVNVDLIVQSIRRNGENDILFTIAVADLDKTMAVLEPVAREIGARHVYRQSGVAKVSIVGAGIAHHSGVAATMFEALAAEGINIEIISTSEIRISCLIAAERVEEAVRAVHRCFNLAAGL